MGIHVNSSTPGMELKNETKSEEQLFIEFTVSIHYCSIPKKYFEILFCINWTKKWHHSQEDLIDLKFVDFCKNGVLPPQNYKNCI